MHMFLKQSLTGVEGDVDKQRWRNNALFAYFGNVGLHSFLKSIFQDQRENARLKGLFLHTGDRD